MTQRVQFVLCFSLLAFFALAVLINGHAQGASQQDTIARIASQYTITFPELQLYVHDHHYAYMYRKHLASAFEKALDDMIVNQLKRIEFFAMGLNKGAEPLQLRRSISEELAIRYYLTQFYDRYVNEGSMRNAYEEMGKEVHYQQIVLAKPMNASRKDIDSLKSLANSIRRRIRNGEDVVRLAKQFSRDREDRSGDTLQLLDWKMSFSSDVTNTTFHLPVDDVRVLETGDTFNIVRVAKVNKRDVQPYANVKEEIRKALDGRYSGLSLGKFEQAKKGLVDEKAVKWNPKGLRQLVQWSQIPKFYQISYADTLREAISHGRNFVILEYAKARVDLKEYLRLLNDVLTWGDRASVSQDDVKKFVLEAVRTSMIVDKAVKLGLQKDVFTPWTTNPILQNEIVRLYNRHEIEEHIPPATDKVLRDFYQANKDSLYYQFAKVNIYAVVDSNKSVIDGMKEQLHQQVPFEKLAPQIPVKTFTRRRDGTLATYLGEEPPFLAEAAFKLKLNEVAGPIEYVDPEKGSEYALIKCVAIRQEKEQSYDDVKRSIAADFANHYREQIGRSVTERLKRKCDVTIYRDVLWKDLSSIGITPE